MADLFTDAGELRFDNLREFLTHAVSAALAMTGLSASATGVIDRGIWREMDRDELAASVAVHIVAGIHPALSREIVRGGTAVARQIIDMNAARPVLREPEETP